MSQQQQQQQQQAVCVRTSPSKAIFTHGTVQYGGVDCTVLDLVQLGMEVGCRAMQH
jgi:hypothetical protein